MLQDPKGKTPKVDKAEVAGIAQQAAGMAADKAAEKAGGRVKEVKEKAQQAAQVASQASAYAGIARQIGSAFQSHEGSNGQTPGISGEEDAQLQPISTSRVSTAAAIASSGIFGVSHLVRLTIFVEGKEIPGYKHFHLSQVAAGHHNFTLVVDHDALGTPQNHEMEDARQLLGKSITVTFAYKNVSDGGPERDFIGVVTQVGFTREYGNRGNIVLSGNSPTVLLDGAPHIQSFGGTQVVSLFTIANTLLKEGLGSKYDYRVEPGFTNNVSYSCQYDETHYNYLARIAQSYGEQFFYDGQKVHFGKLPPPEEPITLTFGKDVEEIDIQLRTRHVNRSLYGYNSSSDERLSTGQTKVEHTSSLAKEAYTISEKTFITPSLRIAPMKAGSNQDVEVAQKSATGSEAVNVFVTKGKTSVPFLYPGCVVQMYMRQPDSAEADYLTKLMITDISHSVDTLGNYAGYFEGIAADTGYLPGSAYHEPVAEPQIATVTDNKDTQGRVQVKFDWQVGGSTSEWIRVMSPDAGGSEKVSKNRGFVAIPEVGDQVMVGFVHHHPDRPYVMGGLFHGKAGGGGGSGNNIKSLSSKSGHTVELNDGGGITIKDKTGGNHVVVDGNNTVTVTSSQIVELTNGSSSIKMDGSKITIYADEIELAKSGGLSSKIEIKGLDTSISGKDSMKVLSDTMAEVNSKGTTDIKATSALTADAATTTVKASGITSVQGAIVNIN
jgi:uncharacterized protein involved in type VI secretion and phage assembly